MAYDNDSNALSLQAEATINDFRFVKGGTADGVVIQAAAATDNGVGAVRYGGSAGQQVRVQVAGIAKIKVGAGGVTRWTRVTSDATGQAVAWATTNRCFGIALESGAVGEIVPVLLVAPAMNVV
jgi:hypothetical protein